MKPNEPFSVQWNGYIFDEKSELNMNTVTLPMKERAAHIFEILNIDMPSDEQQRFARLEITLATKRGNFKDLVFLLAGLMGKLDDYYNKRYVLKNEE